MSQHALHVDVVIIGAGPAGLSCAIALKKANPNRSIAVLEKAKHIGGHNLSGAIVNPDAFAKLGLDWQTFNPYGTVNKDLCAYLTPKRAFYFPMLPSISNKGYPIMSLTHVCQRLAQEAEHLGVDVFTGFAASECLVENNRVVGVKTQAWGLDKNGQKTDHYQDGCEVLATYTVLAEGCRGSLSQAMIKHFKLQNPHSPPNYALGIREVWEVDAKCHQPGYALHTVGWPTPHPAVGGGFIYHTHQPNTVLIGYMTKMDYQNAYIDPHFEMQTFKTHPSIKPLLENGQRTQYGARSINKGGYQALPTLAFPGGVLIGDSAGFFDNGALKGVHNAMHTGMYAAEAISTEWGYKHQQPAPILSEYPSIVKQSPVYKTLYKHRNIRPCFNKGALLGLLYSFVDMMLLRGHVCWTMNNHADGQRLDPKKSFPINYPPVDQKIVFDKASSVALSQTQHTFDQPIHLKVIDPTFSSAKAYLHPELSYCPAGVYEKHPEGHIMMHADKCLHCKTCDFKDPTGNIRWTAPQGGEGPLYDY